MSEMMMEKGQGPELMQDRLLKKRKVLVFGKIDEKRAGQIIAALFFLAEESNEKITMYIDSEGGNETDILAIFDVMRSLECPVETICVGKAHGLTALLVAGGSKGLRKAYQNSEMMLAQVSRDRTFGQASDIELETEHLVQLKGRIVKLLADLCNVNKDKIAADMERKYWLFADEAKAYGLVDELI